MTESLDLDDLARRPIRYWNADGLPELMMGLLWILWGGAWQIGQVLPRGGAWRLYTLLVPALLVLTAVAATWATKKVKARITFPRTGYVAWKEPTGGERLATAGIAMVAAALLAAVVVRSRAAGLEHVAAPSMGVLLSLSFLVASLRQRAPHLLALAGVALTLGLALGALKIGWSAAYWLLIALGAAAVVIGGLRLKSFLDRHPVEERE